MFLKKRFGQFHPGKNDFENRNLANFDMRYRKKLGLIFNWLSKLNIILDAQTEIQILNEL